MRFKSGKSNLAQEVWYLLNHEKPQLAFLDIGSSLSNS